MPPLIAFTYLSLVVKVGSNDVAAMLEVHDGHVDLSKTILYE